MSGQCMVSFTLFTVALSPTLAPASATAWATTVSRPFRSTSKALLALVGQRGSTRRWKKPHLSSFRCIWVLSCFVWVLPMLAIVGVLVRNGSKKCLTLQGYNVRIALKDKLFVSSCKGHCGLKYGVCSALIF